ncbi:MAG: hypothetical protein KDA62_02410 [Planctomycetales bacterium]|nr:hypothetical protein [Planctomycetales bacterium]
MITNGKPRGASASCADGHSDAQVAEPLRNRAQQAAMVELFRAYQYAIHAGRDPWDFAVSATTLLRMNLTESDFRWLVCEGLVHHGREVTRSDDANRCFRIMNQLLFYKRTCFVLTPRGCELADALPEVVDIAPNNHRYPSGFGNEIAQVREFAEVFQVQLPHARPHWDADRRELSVNGLLIKRFKWPAANQETVLAAFAEEDWPFRIDDPLPPQPEVDSKRRLSDTIKCLNRKQQHPLIHFHGDGTGEGITWELMRGS